MPDNSLTDIASLLNQEEQKLTSELSELKKKTKSVETDIKQIHDAQSALGVSKKNGKTPRKPAPTAEEVRIALHDTLKGNEVLREETLLARVEGIIKLNGKSRMGLALRFKECLALPDFTESPNGWQLTSEIERRRIDG